MHFFTNDGGGDPMMFINLIWSWGHPEVYILVLPAFGIFSEVIATFSGKPLFGYRSMVIATMAICLLGFTTWLHHFFTMGSGANVNTFFGITTMIISIPTGVKIFNWIFTMYGGRVRYTSPVLWTIGFIVTFTVGGMTGVLMAIPPADFVLHNSLFLIAHFHNVIIGGVLFGGMAGVNYWFPKAFGFTLDRRLGLVSFWCWLIGFYVAFMPLYALGLLGMTRRLQHTDDHRPDPAAGRQHPHPRTAARCDGRSVERADTRMVDRLAAAVLQLRDHAAGRIARRLLAPQAAAGAATRAPIPRHRSAGEQSERFRRRVLLGSDRLRVDLAHLVDGDPRACLRRHNAARVRVDRAHRPGDFGREPGRRRPDPRHGFEVPMSTGAAQVAGPAAVSSVVAYGFWIFLLSDIIMFSALFAAYAVLSGETAGGPTPGQLFDVRRAGVETLCLLFSSYACGLGELCIQRRRMVGFHVCVAATLVLGAAFLALEIDEFAGMVARGAGPARSAFLSAFFSLVGLHGVHVTIGLLWLVFMVAQIAAQGPKAFVLRRLHCFSLFWHALDIIWIALFTLVYLMGTR